MQAISPGDGIQYDVPMQTPREESFIETPINVPNVSDDRLSHTLEPCVC